MHIVLTPESSNIASFGWQDDTLYIEFKAGVVYAYTDVSIGVYNGMVAADSVGSYFHAHVKKAYTARIIDNEEASLLGFPRADVTLSDA